jgi:hypothetical protein
MFKRTMMAAAAAAVVGAGFSTPASAYVYGLSSLAIEGLQIQTNTPATNVTYTFDLSNSARFPLGSAPVATGASCDNLGSPCGASPVLDAPAANGSGNTLNRANNDFSFLGPTNNGSWATSDSVIRTAELVNFGQPTSTQQIAESQLNTNGGAQANALIQSNTNLRWNFSTEGGTLSLSFTADPALRAAINDLAGLYSAQADLSATFTLTGTGGAANGLRVSWAPQGTAMNDCSVTGSLTVTCVESADTQDLNTNLSTGINPSDQASSLGAGLTLFGVNLANLPAGDYSLALAAQTSNSIRRSVPEPGVLALVGAALLGAGSLRRRSKS